MKNALTIGILAFALAGAAPLHAQRSHPLRLDKLDQGIRVRVQTGASWHEGTLGQPLILSRSDTIVMKANTGLVERIPISSASELLILQSSSRASHVGSGLLLGAVLGAGVAFAAGSGISLAPGGSKGNNAGGLAVVGGVLGSILGGAIGASFGPRPYWVEVQLPLLSP